jgi:hypothetical protein
LVSASGQQVVVPSPLLLGAATLEQYFVLPSQHDLQSLNWETSGLVPRTIPEGLVAPSPDPSAVRSYIRVAEQFRAELTSVEKIAPGVHVKLADIAIKWTSHSACYGVAVLDVEPAGRTTCLLALPPGYRLLTLAVDGRPMWPLASNAERWQISLGDGRLPVRVELVFTGRVRNAPLSGMLFERPRLIGIPTRRTIWTFAGPPEAVFAPHAGAVEANLESVRHAAYSEAVSTAARTLVDSSPERAERWYRRWAPGLIDARRHVDGESIQDDIKGANAGLPPSSERRREIARRLDLPQVRDELSASARSHETILTVWRETIPKGTTLAFATTDGDDASFKLHEVRDIGGHLTTQILVVLCVIMMIICLLAWKPAMRVFDWLNERPRIAAAAIGLFWWLYLLPSALGLLMVLAAAAMPWLSPIARFRWPTMNWRDV